MRNGYYRKLRHFTEMQLANRPRTIAYSLYNNVHYVHKNF